MVSHGAGLGLYGLRPGVVQASGAFLRGLDLGMVPRGPLVAVWIWRALVPLHLMVERRHEAWQGASVSKQGSVSGGRVAFPACSRMAQDSCLCGSDVRVPCVLEAGFLFLRSLPTNPGAGLVRDGGWIGTCVVVWLLWLETFFRFHSMQDPKIGGVPSRGRGEGEDDCEVSFGMLVVSQSRHRRLEPASFDKLRFSGHLWATALCNRILPVAGPFDCRFILLSSACHSEGSEEPQPCQGDPLLRSG